MKRNRKRGVTIIEALIVVCVGTMVVGVVLALVSFSTRSFGRTQQRLDPREGASRILMALRSRLVDASRYKIGAEGRNVMFMTPREVGSLTYEAATGTIAVSSIAAPGAVPEPIAIGVKKFSVHQLKRGVLRVTLEIDRPLVQDGLASLGPLVVVDEIHCPVVRRERRIPWHRTYEPRGPRSDAPAVDGNAFLAD